MSHIVTRLQDSEQFGEGFENTVREIQELYRTLTQKPPVVNRAFTTQCMIREDLHFLVAREYKGERRFEISTGKVIGMGSIYFRSTVLKRWSVIEDIAVLPEKRSAGIGEDIVSQLIQFARKDVRAPTFVELTSRPEPERDSARRLYEKLGFRLIAKAEEGGTNLYRLYF